MFDFREISETVALGCYQKFMGSSIISCDSNRYDPKGRIVRLFIGVGYVVAKIGSKILHLDRRWEKFVIACSIFQNVLITCEREY
jgi:hypothetical protein